MKIIICLGNPGTQYQLNRHNIGFLMADFMIKKYEGSSPKSECKSLTSKILINNKKCLIVKPQTYMNLSGEAVQKITSFYKTSLNNILIIYDDIEIKFGYIRFKLKGRAGTHNGMKSILEQLNQTEIPRLRMGIGLIPDHVDIKQFVLSDFNQSENANFNNLFEKSSLSIENWVNDCIEQSMLTSNKKYLL